MSRASRLPHAWVITVYFFLGSVVSLVAFDLSDYANYAAQATGHVLSPLQQVWYYALFPSVLYGLLALLAFLFAKYRLSSPVHFLEGFLVLVVIFPAALAFTLPQSHSLPFDFTVLGGTLASVAIGVGIVRRVRH
ncbi:MAG: hypothetical protein KGO96_13140 [Elusimicrobia bacterium]|nr:hypothetical protein [Elusimicrobiota bacterium]MDE2426839.1 hypothetical protein [Elusimicrobiota bacterium]